MKNKMLYNGFNNKSKKKFRLLSFLKETGAKMKWCVFR